MKLQETPNKIQGKWRYQAQFYDAKKAQQAVQWLAGRLLKDLELNGSSISTNDLQIIFELRLFLEPEIKILRLASK